MEAFTAGGPEHCSGPPLPAPGRFPCHTVNSPGAGSGPGTGSPAGASSPSLDKPQACLPRDLQRPWIKYLARLEKPYRHHEPAGWNKWSRVRPQKPQFFFSSPSIPFCRLLGFQQRDLADLVGTLNSCSKKCSPQVWKGKETGKEQDGCALSRVWLSWGWRRDSQFAGKIIIPYPLECLEPRDTSVSLVVFSVLL